MQKKTHREVKKPEISARYLADYMAASETAKRTIVQKCKFHAIARVIQHDAAKLAVSTHIRFGEADVSELLREAQKLRDRLASDDFDREVLDNNADYIERFASVRHEMKMPRADIIAPGRAPALIINGVAVKPQIQLRLQRLARGNKVRAGAATLRYAKGKALAPGTADWQSAFLYGYLLAELGEGPDEPEHGLCLTIDACAGVAHPAPTDAVRRYQNMKAACASIAERWPNVAPPPKAVL